MGIERSGLLWQNKQISIKVDEILLKEKVRLHEAQVKKKSSMFPSKEPNEIDKIMILQFSLMEKLLKLKYLMETRKQLQFIQMNYL